MTTQTDPLSLYEFTCDTCGRVGTVDDGIAEHGDDCPADDCDGTVRRIAFDVDAIVADLTDDDDSHVIETADGVWTFTLHVEADDMSILDEQGEGVWCGRLEYGTTDRYNGHDVRPAGFDGNAERLDRYDYRGDFEGLWWQPPTDVTRGTDTFDALRRDILDVLTYGYQYFYVTATHVRGDGYTREWRSMGLGGIFGDIPGDYLADQIAELCDEVTS